MESRKIEVPLMADLFARGEKPEYLFWVGCAGAFDDRYKKVVRAFAKILTHLNVSFAVLGKEETCNGDPARRAGNEMLYQMQALQVIEIFRMYDVLIVSIYLKMNTPILVVNMKLSTIFSFLTGILKRAN